MTKVKIQLNFLTRGLRVTSVKERVIVGTAICKYVTQVWTPFVISQTAQELPISKRQYCRRSIVPGRPRDKEMLIVHSML